MPETILGLPTTQILAYAWNIIAAIAIFIAGLYVGRWIARFVTEAAIRSKLESTVAQVLGRISRALVTVLTVLAILNRFGFETTSLVALLGAAGLAIGLALQGALGNVASGVMLLVLRPFKLGDMVEVTGTVGKVEDIGLFVTRFTTTDNVAVYMPNSSIWGSKIQNYSHHSIRRIDMVFQVSYSYDIDKAIQAMKGILASHPMVLKDPEPLVTLGELGDGVVKIWVRPWVQSENYWKAYLEIIKQIKTFSEAEGLQKITPPPTVVSQGTLVARN